MRVKEAICLSAVLCDRILFELLSLTRNTHFFAATLRSREPEGEEVEAILKEKLKQAFVVAVLRA